MKRKDSREAPLSRDCVLEVLPMAAAGTQLASRDEGVAYLSGVSV